MGRQIPRGFTQRFAKITPIQDQQPDVLTRDLGRKDKADPNEALFQALTSYLYQRHEDQNGLEYPFVAVLIEPTPGQLQVLDHDAYAELVATDTTYSAHFRHKWTFWDSRHAVALKRYDSDKEVLLSVEELLNEGKSKSGANGLPFYYLPPEHSTTLKEVTYYLHDHLGNMRLTYSIPCVAGTQVPTLLHAADYYPYGSILRQHINGAQEKYLTTHHERDLETGLDYRGARYYDSDVARFLSLDPLAADYASWSPYNYVMGNPVSLVDPTGRSATKYEDEAGNELASTNDGNNATVTVASGDVEAFKSEYSTAAGNGEQNSMMNNESWIRRFGDQMRVDPGGRAASWAVTAMGYDPNVLIPAGIGAAGSLLEENVAQILRNRARYDFKGAPYEPTRFPTRNVTVRTPIGGIEMPKTTLGKVGVSLKVGGWAMGAYQAADLYNQKQQGLISGWRYYAEQGSNAISTFGGIYGVAWSLGWEGGRAITNIPAYKDWKQNTWLPFREK